MTLLRAADTSQSSNAIMEICHQCLNVGKKQVFHCFVKKKKNLQKSYSISPGSLVKESGSAMETWPACWTQLQQ